MALDQIDRFRHVTPMLIFKIFRAAEWTSLATDGFSDGAPIDLSDGYIHMSTAAQSAETAAKHFSGQENLTIGAIKVDSLGDDLRWEPSRGGDLFPHLYRRLFLDDILWSADLPLGSTGHVFPRGVE